MIAVADEQIADALLDCPSLQVARIQSGVKQCPAVDRVHAKLSPRAARHASRRGDPAEAR